MTFEIIIEWFFSSGLCVFFFYCCKINFWITFLPPFTIILFKLDTIDNKKEFIHTHIYCFRCKIKDLILKNGSDYIPNFLHSQPIGCILHVSTPTLKLVRAQLNQYECSRIITSLYLVKPLYL